MAGRVPDDAPGPERVAFSGTAERGWIAATVLRDSNIIAWPGARHYETMAWRITDGKYGALLYQYATAVEKRARHAHYVISKRLGRLADAGMLA